MSYCTKCGKKVKPGSSFCTGCGTPIRKIESQNIPSSQDSLRGPQSEAAPISQDSPHGSQSEIGPIPQDSLHGSQGAIPTSQDNLYEPSETAPIPQDRLHSSPTTVQTSPKRAKYCKPITFRITALVLAIVLIITATVKLSRRRPPTSGVPMSQSQVSLLYTDKDYANAPTVRAKISSDMSTADLGDLKVDFGSWNIETDDEVLLRSLVEKSDKYTGTKIKGYDLSLESGKSTFYTPVSVTIPCTIGEDESGSIVMLNEENNSWEYIYYELSEDGKSYIAYMPHFSTIGEKKVNKYIGTEVDIRDTKDGLSTTGSMYQYMSFTGPDGGFIPLVEREVYMSDDVYRQLFYKNIKAEELNKLIEMGDLPQQDSVTFTLSTLSNVESTTDGAILYSQIDKALSATGKIRLAGAMATFGAVLTFGRIAYQANKGGDFSAIIQENKYTLMTAALGALSYGAAYVGAAAAATAFTIASAVVFVWSIGASFIDMITDADSIEEATYRFFAESGQMRFNENLLCVDYPNGDFKLAHTDQSSFARALRLIYDAYANKPIELDEAVSKFYHDYTNVFWQWMTEEQRGDFSYKKYLGEPIIRSEWNEPSTEKIEKYKDRMMKETVSVSRDILRSFAIEAFSKMANDLYDTLKKEVEPYLNRKLTFIVKDSNLKPGETFDISSYASGSIYFKDKTAPQFGARFVSSGAYKEEYFTPHVKKDSDIVYECTMYHYIMMGCPTEMTFADNSQENLPGVTVNFEIGEEDEIVIEIEPLKSGIYIDESQSGNVVVPAFRIEKKKDGITVAACDSETGDYYEDAPIECIFNTKTHRYEGSISGEGYYEDQIVTVVISVEPKGGSDNPQAYIKMEAALNEGPYETLFEGNVIWEGPLRGSMIEIEKPEPNPDPVPSTGGLPVGGNPAFR